MESVSTIQSKIDQLTTVVKEIFLSVNTQKLGKVNLNTNKITIDINLDSFSLNEFELKIPLLRQTLEEYAVLKARQDEISQREQREITEINAVGNLPGLTARIPI